MAKSQIMKLAAYLEAHDLNPTQFGERAGMPASTIIRILNGQRAPRLATIARIERATGGVVTVADFYERPKAEGKAA